MAIKVVSCVWDFAIKGLPCRGRLHCWIRTDKLHLLPHDDCCYSNWDVQYQRARRSGRNLHPLLANETKQAYFTLVWFSIITINSTPARAYSAAWSPGVPEIPYPAKERTGRLIFSRKFGTSTRLPFRRLSEAIRSSPRGRPKMRTGGPKNVESLHD